MFTITTADRQNIVISGRFSAANTEEAENILRDINNNCSIDMKDLEYISSAGIGTLLRAYVRLKESGFTLKIFNMNKHISEVFKYSGLDKIFLME